MTEGLQQEQRYHEILGVLVLQKKYQLCKGLVPDRAARVRGSSQSWSSCGSKSSSPELSGLQIIARPQSPRLRPPDPKHTLVLCSLLKINLHRLRLLIRL